jgi:hypothetical protein
MNASMPVMRAARGEACCVWQDSPANQKNRKFACGFLFASLEGSSDYWLLHKDNAM